MKQSKKMTRHQREFLTRRKIDTENVRVLEETSEYIKIIKDDKTIQIIEKT